jgi:hypothetical protein
MKNIHEGGDRLCFTLWTWSTMACPWDSSWLCLCRGGWSCTEIWLLELDIPGTEGGVTLGEVLGGIILWEKCIMFPGSAPRRPPSPPSRRNSPPPSPPSTTIGMTTTTQGHLDLHRLRPLISPISNIMGRLPLHRLKCHTKAR